MKTYYQNGGFTLYHGDCLKVLKHLEQESVNCCVTSPPYWGLRDYNVPPTEWPEVSFSPMAGLDPITIPAETCCLGLEKHPFSFVGHIVTIFREVSRVLRDDATIWLNIGDSYSTNGGGDKLTGIHKTNKGSAGNQYRTPGKIGLKKKDLVGIPWRVGLALQAEGFYLRIGNIWNKTNTMTESVKDRPTLSHEYILFFSKSEKYAYDNEAIKEPCVTDPKEKYFERAKITGRGKQGFADARGRDRDKSGGFPVEGTNRNKRSVWTFATRPYKGAHFATFNPELPRTCIKAGCPKGGVVLDLFNGAGTTGMEAHDLGMQYIGIDIKKEYLDMTIQRVEYDLNQLRF